MHFVGDASAVESHKRCTHSSISHFDTCPASVWTEIIKVSPMSEQSSCGLIDVCLTLCVSTNLVQIVSCLVTTHTSPRLRGFAARAPNTHYCSHQALVAFSCAGAATSSPDNVELLDY